MAPFARYIISATQEELRHHPLAPAERATRPESRSLKSAHSLHSPKACDVYTKRVLAQWNGCQDAMKSAHSLHSPKACDVYTKRVLAQWNGCQIIEECPLTAFPEDLRRLHEASPDAVKWLSDHWRVPTHCIPRRPAMSTRTESWRSGMVVRSLKSAHSLHSPKICDVYMQRVLAQWNGCQIIEECLLTAFPEDLRCLHEVSPGAVKWLSDHWRMPTHCIPRRPATSTRSESWRSGMVVRSLKSAHSLHSPKTCDVYTKRVLAQWNGCQIIEECLLTAFPEDLRRLHEASPGAVEWLSDQWRVPTHCIPRRPATSTRSESWRSGMVVRSLKSAHSLHSPKTCDVYTKRVLAQWNGCQIIEECPLTAFPEDLWRLHEASPGAVKWLSDRWRVPTHCIPRRPATSTRSESWRSEMVVRSLKSAHSLHSPKACDVYTKRVLTQWNGCQIVEECLLTAFPEDLWRLHEASPGAVKWLSDHWRVPTHCIPRRPATSTRTESWRSGMVVRSLKSAYSLHSPKTCDVYTKRVLAQWNGCQIVEECPLIAFPEDLRRLHEASPDAVKWLLDRWRVPTHCIPRRPAMSTRSESWRSEMVVRSLKSAHSLHSPKTCDVYTKRVLAQWNGCQINEECLLTAFPEDLRRLHEASPGAVEWLSDRWRVPTHCIPRRPAMSTRTESWRSGMVVRSLKSAHSLHSPKACDVYTKRVLTQWNGCQIIEEYPLTAFPEGLRRLHEASPGAVKWLSDRWRVPTHCIPRRPAMSTRTESWRSGLCLSDHWRVPTHCIPRRPATSTRSESWRSGMVVRSLKSAHSLHSPKTWDVYTKQVLAQWNGCQIIEECPLTAFPEDLRRLHEASPDAVEWLSDRWRVPTHCIPRRPATSTRSESWRSEMVVRSLKSAHSLHSPKTCDVYTKRVLKQWNGCQIIEECLLTAFPEDLGRLHEASPGAVKWLSDRWRVPTHCIPRRPAMSTRSESWRSGMVVRSLKSAYSLHSPKTCDVYTKRVLAQWNGCQIVEECLLTAFPEGLRRLHEASPDAVKWLSDHWRVPTHCIPRRPATSTRSESWRSGMVVRSLKSAHSLHSPKACDVYTKRVLAQWNGCQIIEECPLTAFPEGLRRLHEASPGAVEWLSDHWRVPTHCIPRRPATSTRSESWRSGMVVRSLKSAHSLHSPKTCDVYTKRVLAQWNGCPDAMILSVPSEQLFTWATYFIK